MSETYPLLVHTDKQLKTYNLFGALSAEGVEKSTHYLYVQIIDIQRRPRDAARAVEGGDVLGLQRMEISDKHSA